MKIIASSLVLFVIGLFVLGSFAGNASAYDGEFTPHRCSATAKFEVLAGHYTSCTLARNAAKAVEAEQVRFNHIYVKGATGRVYYLRVACGSASGIGAHQLLIGGPRSNRPIEITLTWKHGRCIG